MRALFDPNVLISYLLTPGGSSPPVAIVEAALAGVFSLLLTAGVVTEVRAKTATKPYLAARIAPSEVEALMRLLAAIAEILPEIEEVPAVSRDRKTTTSWPTRSRGGPTIWSAETPTCSP